MATTVKERPVLFSGPMVKAILAGKKTQTRRVMKGNFAPDEFIRKKSGTGYGWWPFGGHGDLWGMTGAVGVARDAGFDTRIKCPYGMVGDRLWVRETFCDVADYALIGRLKKDRFHYAADGKKAGWRYRPSIHMPRIACRIVLEITEIRVQRLQEITWNDAMAEGIVECDIPADEEGPNRIGFMVHPDDGESGLDVTPMQTFQKLWDSINANRGFGWDRNPWVWAVTFKRV